MRIVFFGSFQAHSTQILKSLVKDPDITVVGIITTPPKPAGKDKKLKPTHTHSWALEHGLPVFTPHTLNQETLEQLPAGFNLSPTAARAIDFFIVAGYGKLLPDDWLTYPRYKSLNCHFSLLPKFRGANPAEWAILLGESSTGITLITMDRQLDTGHIIDQHSLPIESDDTRATLYHKLYQLAADQLPSMLGKYYRWLHKKDFACQTSLAPRPQPVKSPTPHAYLFKRDDGFIPWECISSVIAGDRIDDRLLQSHLKTTATHLKLFTKKPLEHVRFIERAIRALHGYPGVWTLVDTTNGQKRFKIHTANIHKGRLVLHQVQLEGLKSTPFNQVKNNIKKP